MSKFKAVFPDISQVSDFLSKRLQKPVEFDDRVDQLNYIVTPSLLLVFAGILPNTFSPELRKFAMEYCFVENVYFVGLKEEIPDVVGRQSREFKYYQWVPYLLLLQAAMFSMPIWVWKNHYRQSETSPGTVMKDARKLKHLREDQRRRCVQQLAVEIADCLDLDEEQCAFRQSLWYLLTKLIFLLNIAMQFVLVGAFIGRGYNAWFWSVLLTPFGLGGDYGGHTIQCMLPINQFNEKVFFFLSVYFSALGIVTLFNTFSWAIVLTSRSERYDVVRLLVKKDTLKGAEVHLIRFVDDVLKTDGILLLHFIKGTAGASVAREVCTQLFDAYKHSRSGKLMRLRPAIDAFSATMPSKNAKAAKILSGPSKKKVAGKTPELLALFNQIPVSCTESSLPDSGFGRESSDSYLIGENPHEASSRSDTVPQNGVSHAGKKKQKAKIAKESDSEDWAIIGASWELD
ncbi:innexin family protein [Aphelenchoides avenae]|nr:innexin family protein [Aphelenchus avenae]